MKNKVGLGIGIVVLVLLLAGGAFTAVNLLTAKSDSEAPGTMITQDVFDDGSGNPVSVTTIIEPSPDLPQEDFAGVGIFLREVDNSYFIGTGNISLNIEVINGDTSTVRDHSGPEVEVVVGRDTVVYKDVTEVDPTPTESGERRYVQEIVQIDKPDELSEGANIVVWGDKTGDRIIADVIVISDER